MTKTGALMASSIFRGRGVLCKPKGEHRTDRARRRGGGGNLHSLSDSSFARSMIGERGGNFVPRTQSAVGVHTLRINDQL